MLSSLIKEHQLKQQTRKEEQERRRKDAIAAAGVLTQALVDHLNVGVAQAYLNQRKLDVEAKQLNQHAATFAKQTQLWLQMVETFSTALKELGDVENWAKSIEGDMRSISQALEYSYKGGFPPTLPLEGLGSRGSRTFPLPLDIGLPLPTPPLLPTPPMFIPSMIPPSLFPNPYSIPAYGMMPLGRRNRVSGGCTKELFTMASAPLPCLIPEGMNPDVPPFEGVSGVPPPIHPPPGTYFDVHIPFALNPSNFVVQSWLGGKDLEDLMEKMNSFYEGPPLSSPLLPETIREGECYAALYFDRIWYRIIVSKCMGNDTFFAHFLDFGNNDFFCSGSLRPLAAEFRKLPAQAIKACLAGIAPVSGDGWRDEDILVFREMVFEKQFVSVVPEGSLPSKDDDRLPLTLIDTSLPDRDVFVDQALVEKGNASRRLQLPSSLTDPKPDPDPPVSPLESDDSHESL
ncbi:unnamed protein product [Darwinula stevensoni]|uniref:Biogenesis of lysosome-related organelles complex 1 subunit 1 n=1 Tax=Darwinula stevensoni TaxID=69355 RepID=A0A7R8X8A2_9CRUS|nr:unnamed protein product [Darwinula stevensoni]CAG0887727.1 unnamed protein product [Darwinula stevensoni]